MSFDKTHGLGNQIGNAPDHAKAFAPIIARLDPTGSLSLRELAAKLTAEGLPTPANGATLTAATVQRIKAKLAA